VFHISIWGANTPRGDGTAPRSLRLLLPPTQKRSMTRNSGNRACLAWSGFLHRRTNW